jgi:glycosyltransferase involved in cell wall biosynthesis
MKVAVLFDFLGPYHRARLDAAAQTLEVAAIEVREHSAEYAWERPQGGTRYRLVPLMTQSPTNGSSEPGLRGRVFAALDDLWPDAVAIPGWSIRAAFAALQWCVRQGVPAVVMLESNLWDELQVAWKMWTKRRLVALFSSALVGGRPQGDYLAKLGMPRNRIFSGYDAIDNKHFADQAAESRKQKAESGEAHGLPERYFLASARFVEKKNLFRLIEAYAKYRSMCGDQRPQTTRQQDSTDIPLSGSPAVPWSLVLLGDGPLRPALNSQLSTLNLHGHVLLPGFKQYPDLPTYYGLASAFIHASTTEQWGLVVNEAMASGLPVLVSNRCGCAPDLVQEGVNGFTFDPYDVQQLTQLMLRLSTFNSQLSTMAAASRRIIANWGPNRFASGLKAAVDCALAVGPKKASPLDRVILRALIAC